MRRSPLLAPSFAQAMVAFSLALVAPNCFGDEPEAWPEPAASRLSERFLPKGTASFSAARGAPNHHLTVYKGQIFLQGGERGKVGQVDWGIAPSRPRDELVGVFGASGAKEPDDMGYDTWGESNLVVSKGRAPGGTWQLLTSDNPREVGCYFRVGEGEFEGYYLNFEKESNAELTELTGNPCYRAIVTPKPGVWSLLKMTSAPVKRRR